MFILQKDDAALQHVLHNESDVVGHYACAKHQFSPLQCTGICASKNNNTSSILTKQLCLLQITWLKKVVPTKSYSLVMLHFRHTRMLSSCATPMTSQAIVSYFSNLKLFSTFMQYMSVSHGYSTMVEQNGGCGEYKKGKIVSHQLGVSMGYGDAH